MHQAAPSYRAVLAVRTPLAVSLALLAGTMAAADVIKASYQSLTIFDYQLLGMPDLDQRRSDLPGNGSMYCVPTAAMNLFAYQANHGFAIAPGAADWQSNDHYDDATDALTQMGMLMGTTAAGGTSGNGSVSGYQSWLMGNSFLAFGNYWNSNEFTVSLPEMVKLAEQGWIVSFCYGRYDIVGMVGDVPLVTRNGGHAVTLTGAKATLIDREIRYRDPATDSADLETQSVFADNVINWAPVTVALSPTNIRTMTAIDYPSEDGRIRLIDQFWVIRPNFAVNYFPVALGNRFTLIDPGPLLGSVNLSLPEIPLPSNLAVLDMALHPMSTQMYFLQQPATSASTMQLLDLFTGMWAPVPNAPTALKHIVTSRRGEIYGTDGLKLYRMKGDTGDLKGSTSSTPPVTALAMHDGSDSLWVLSVAQRRLVRFIESLDSSSANWIVPTQVPMAGDGSVAPDPTSGMPYFCTDASNSIFGLSLNEAGGIVVETISLPEIVHPRSLRFDGAGRLFVICDGSVRVLRKLATAGWQLDAGNPFQGAAAGQFMTLTSRRTNFDPAQHLGTPWADIPAQDLLSFGHEVPDCLGDLDADGMVDGDDLGTLLGLWGTARELGDLDHSGLVDGGDLGSMLGQWGPCR